ncbi:MAG: CGNR zinc finger domain-containing protein [Acidobacteriota bacterium]
MSKNKKLTRGPQLELAGDLSVAFVNTAAAREKNRQQGVSTYHELLVWSQQVGILQAAQAERLWTAAGDRPEAAAAALQRVLTARAALARLFIALQTQGEMPPGDLGLVNEALGEGMSAARLVPGEEGLVWGWAGDENALERPLWPALHAGAELLISTGGQPHVRQCALSGCRLFFIDRSRARQRRWCDMKTCGNRAKSLRFYRKTGKAAREERTWGIALYKTKRPRPSLQKL